MLGVGLFLFSIWASATHSLDRDTYPQCHERVLHVTGTVTQLGGHELGHSENLWDHFLLSFVKPDGDEENKCSVSFFSQCDN